MVTEAITTLHRRTQDEAIAGSLRFRALRAHQQRRERQVAPRVDATPDAELVFTLMWLKQQLFDRFGVTGVRNGDLTSYWEGDGRVTVSVAIDGCLFTAEYGRPLAASAQCPGCGEVLSAQPLTLADLGELLEQAAMHCGGSHA